MAAPAEAGVGLPRGSPLRNRDFARVWSASVVSLTGDWILFVGLPFFIYRLTGSALATGGALAVGLVPQIALGSVAGVFVDRWSRQRTMIVANLALAAGLLPLLLVTSPDRLGIVYAVLFGESCVEQFFIPAQGALIPRLVPSDRLVEANALQGGGRQGSRLAGAALGGLVVGLWGLAGVTLADLASFLVAAVLIASVARDAPAVSDRVRSAGRGLLRAWRRLAGEWADGVRLAMRSPSTRGLLAYTGVTQLGEGVFGTLLAPFIVGVLRGNGFEYGAFLAVQALGGIAGTAGIVSRGGRWSPRRVLPAASVIFGAIDLVLFSYPLFWPTLGPAFILVAAVGLPAAALGATYTSLLQTEVPDRYRGRFLGAVATTGSLTMLAGVAVAGFLAPAFGIIPVLEIQGVVYVAAGAGLAILFGSEAAHPQERPASWGPADQPR